MTTVSKFESVASSILDGLAATVFSPFFDISCHSVEPVGNAQPDATVDASPDAPLPDGRPDVGPDGPTAPPTPECVEPGDNDRFIPNSNGNSFVWADMPPPDTTYSVKLWKLSRPDEDKPASMPDDQYNGENGSDIFFLDTRTDYLWEISAYSVHDSDLFTQRECRFTTRDIGLVGWWRFEEDTGTLVEDWSGNNNDGMLRGAPERVPSNEIVGNVLRLNVPGTTNDYVFVADDPSLDGMEELTVEAWVNYQNDPVNLNEGNLGIVSKAGTDLGSYILRTDETGEGVETERVSFSTDTDPEGPAVKSTSEKKTDNGVWHYLAATYNGLSQQIFIDSVLEDDSIMAQTGNISNSDTPVCFGTTCMSTTVTYRFFRGDMDEIAIYDRALESAEILANCHRIAPTQCP